MTDYISNYTPNEAEKNKFLVKTYAWMGFALALSSVTAFLTSISYNMMYFLLNHNAAGLIILAAAELALVFILSRNIRTLSTAAAKAMFLAYSVINGITLSTIFLIYSITSISLCFFGAALTFAVMAIYGACTKKNLATLGHYLMMALFGAIIVSLIEIAVKFIFHIDLSIFDWLISLVTLGIFIGLTAYDSQKILKTAERAYNSDDYKKLAVLGALELYLDFINIFLTLLRLFGRRK